MNAIDLDIALGLIFMLLTVGLGAIGLIIVVAAFIKHRD